MVVVFRTNGEISEISFEATCLYIMKGHFVNKRYESVHTSNLSKPQI